MTPRVGRRIIAKSPVAPLARGFAKQKEIVHACAQRGLNAATQKVSSSIKTLLQEAGDAIKTRSLEPAFAGIERVERTAEQAASQSKALQPRRSERLKKIEKAASTQSKTLSIKELDDRIRKLDHNVLDEMEKAGGHALEKHVGRTHQELIRRSIQEEVAVSSFYDKQTATKAILSNLRNNAEKIATWLKDSSNKDNMTFDYKHRYSIGLGIGEETKTGITQITTSKVVLKKSTANQQGFIILTSYPSVSE